ncbi:MAG: efflux RND transporter permease subunit, partial [Gammaproteobacteria bacterium]
MIPHYFIDRPIFAWVIALVIVLAGLLSLRQLPVSMYPEVAPPALSINVTYPGASAQVIEETVTAIIEQEMNGIENLQYMESSSESAGVASITLTFLPGTNLDIASVEAQNRIKRAEPRLPEEVRRQGITVTKSRRNFLMIVVLHSPDGSMSNIDLSSYAAANLLEQIRRVPGVGEANLFGSEYAMRIWLDPNKLTAYGLTPGDALRAVRAQNVQLATGELNQTPALPGQELAATIITQGKLTTPEEFGNIILRATADGTTVRLKDVARVELGAQDYSVRSRLNGKPSAGIGIKLSPTGNALETAAAVKAKMEELSRFFPEGVAWDIPYDSSRFIDISIKEVLKTLLEAFLLVFLVMWLFLENLRAAVIPTIVVPVALVGALTGLAALGFSINLLTLFAMVLAIGIVVDDAIVVVENVERIMTQEGLSPREATRKAMSQIVNAIIAITLVLSAVFVPMAFFGGSVGAIYRQFAVTLVFTMLFSALMAFTLTPALCANLLRHVSRDELMPRTGFFGWFNRFFARTTNGYLATVARVLRRPLRLLAIYIALAIATGWLFLRVPGGFLPEEDQGYIINVVQLPPGATQERTLEVLEQLEQHYLSQPEVEKVIGVAGFSFFGRGQNGAIAFARLKDWSERKEDENHVLSVIRKANMAFFQIKQAMLFAINPPPIPELAAVGGFDFRLQDRAGVGREKLLEARNLVLGLASQDPRLAGVRPEGQEASPQLLLDIDRVKAQSLGIELAELNDTLQATLGTAYINDFVRQGRILRVQMQADAETRSTPDKVLSVRVRNARGELIPLSEIATPRWVVGAPKLDRYNGVPAMKVAGNPAPGYSTGDALAAMEEIGRQLPPGIGFEWSGTSFEERVSGAQAPLLFGLSLLVVFLVLAALYESWSIPFAVILLVPVGVFGAVLGVLLRDLPNDVYFKVGLIATIGLSAKNAILIIEFARQLQDEGRDIIESIIEACRLRFRPILMTSIAFICGVLPLAVASGAGAASRH